jgi:hypothetical protein
MSLGLQFLNSITSHYLFPHFLGQVLIVVFKGKETYLFPISTMVLSIETLKTFFFKKESEKK